MLRFSQQFDSNNDLESVTHLRDFAETIGIDTTWLGALDSTTEAETLANARQVIAEAIAERLAEEEARKRPACPIGPYGGGICLICGGRDPNC